MRHALALCLAFLASPALAWTDGGSPLNLHIPALTDSGSSWSEAIRYDLAKISTASVVNSSTSWPSVGRITVTTFTAVNATGFYFSSSPVVAAGSVTASGFFGDGSHLTGISQSTATVIRDYNGNATVPYGVVSSSVVTTYVQVASMTSTGGVLAYGSIVARNAASVATVSGGNLNISDGTNSGDITSGAGSGELLAGLRVAGANGSNLVMRSGTTLGDTIQAYYWDGGAYRSAWEVPRTVGFSTITFMKSGGMVGIGKAASAVGATLDVNGNAAFSSGITASSVTANYGIKAATATITYIEGSSITLTVAGTALTVKGVGGAISIANASNNITLSGTTLSVNDGTQSGTAFVRDASGELGKGLWIAGGNGNNTVIRGGTTAGDKAQIGYWSGSAYTSAFEVPAVSIGKSTATIMLSGGPTIIGGNVSAASQAGVRAWSNTPMVIPNGSAITRLYFENHSWGPDGDIAHSTTVSSDTFTMPTAGKYSVNACIQLNNAQAMSRIGLKININGTTKTETEYNIPATGYNILCVNDLLKIAANDVLTVNLSQNGASTQATLASQSGSYVTIQKVW